MSTENPFYNNEMMPVKPSSSLNVITILTIIASFLELPRAIFAFFTAEADYTRLKTIMNTEDIQKAPEFVRGMVNEKSLQMAEKMVENKVPMMIAFLVGAILCLAGAFAMRKLKAQGYSLWMIGEILPIVATAVFIGTDAFSGLSLIAYIFPVLFMVLYTVHRKELVK
jgi:hypothetical protein